MGLKPIYVLSIPWLLQADLPNYVIIKQVAALSQDKEHDHAQDALSFKGTRVIQKGRLGARTNLLSSASHAVAFLLEQIQEGFNGVVQFVEAHDGKLTFQHLCQLASLQAIARVAESEGSHAIMSLSVSANNRTCKGKIAHSDMATSPELTASTVLHSRLVPSLNAAKPAPYSRAPALTERGSVLISGGLGGLGLLVGHCKAQQGCTKLLLLGRTGRANEDYRNICTSHAEVVMARCDVSSGEETATVSTNQFIGSIVHAGGVLRDGLISKQTSAGVREVMAPKVAGLCNLGQRLLTHGGQMTVFSSIAGVLGSAGQANYAAANSYMDTWAQKAADQVSSQL